MLMRRWPAVGLLWLAVAAALTVLAGCIQGITEAPSPGSFTPTSINPASLVLPPATGTLTPTLPSALVLKFWLPKQLDPSSGEPAGNILRTRLEQFLRANPGVELDIRLKAENGPGGLLDSLASASAAAPQALPHLVIMPRAVLGPAALKGYIRSLDGQTSLVGAPDWYPYARDLGRIQQSTFGLPLAGDALVMAYLPDAINQPPKDWAQTLAISATLAFPAADPSGLFTLAQYQAAGGRIQDDQGRPILDEDVLVNVLAFFQQANQNGRVPAWLEQFETDEQAWEARLRSPAVLSITWASRILQSNGAVQALRFASIPTESGQPFTLTTGWVLALSGHDLPHDTLAVRLAEFLCDPVFLGQWSAAAGYLPTRSSALDNWIKGPAQEMVKELIPGARLAPSPDILAVLGPNLRQAVSSVLTQQESPNAAAKTAASQLGGP